MTLVSLIIPTYNSQEFINQNLVTLNNFLGLNFPDYEIIVVDDGSTDSTPQIVEKIKNDKIIYLHLAKNKGKGYAVRHGYKFSKGEFLIFIDSDLPYHLRALNQMVKELASSDLVIGSRNHPESVATAGISLYRQIGSLFLSKAVEAFILGEYIDTQCGLKGLSRNSADFLFSKMTIDGFSFDIEMLYHAIQNGMRIKQIPVNFINNKNSTVSLSKTIRMIWDVGQLWLKK